MFQIPVNTHKSIHAYYFENVKPVECHMYITYTHVCGTCFEYQLFMKFRFFIHCTLLQYQMSENYTTPLGYHLTPNHKSMTT